MINLKRKAAAGPSYNWRPNFRDFESLPDISVVRVKFFLPTFLGVAVLIAVSYILFNEYEAAGINDSIDSLQTELDSQAPEHDKLVKLNSEFMTLDKGLKEILDFKSGTLLSSDLLLSISTRVKEKMHLTRLEYSAERVLIEGDVKVAAEEASVIVDAFLLELEKGAILEGVLDQYSLTSLQRDERKDTIHFRIEITAAEKEKGKGKS